MIKTRILAVAVVVLAAAQVCTLQAKPKPPQDPVAVFQAYVAAWNHHDFAGFDALLAPDALHEDIAQGVAARGPAAVKDFMRAVIASEPDFDWHVDRVFPSGSTVAAEWTWTATYTGDSPSGPVKGLHITGRGASIVTVENGRITRFTDYYDNASFFPKKQ